MEHPKKAVKRGYGVKTEVYSISLHKSIAKLMDDFLEEEGLQRSYFVQECIKKGLEQYRERGFVYFIKWGEKDFKGLTTIKIGKTKNPSERLNQLAGGNGTTLPVRLEMLHIAECDNAKKVESLLHRHFSKKRIEHSEYFLLEDSDIKWILDEGYRDLRGIIQFLSS